MKTKKALAAILCVLMIFVSLTFGMLTAYAETVTLDDTTLGLDIVSSTKGYDDNVWFIFTPTTSGIYTLYGLSSNTYGTEAYLFEKTEVNGKKTYTQLAYSNGNPNYANYEGAGRRQFCLAYHMTAGKTYYYAAGWNDETKMKGTITVRHICESYDTAQLVSIVPDCDATLTWYTGGRWETNEAGNPYYYYDISKIIQNMSLTITFDDGTVITSNPGSSDVGGYPIKYNHNQSEVHWYNSENPDYTANTLTVTVLDKSVDYNVVIEQGAMFTVKGKIIDSYDSSPVSGAQIVINSNTVATTGSDGCFSFPYSPGTYTVTIKGSGIVKRTFTLGIDAQGGDKNDHTSTPVSVVTGDYIADDIINGRDFAYIKRNLSGADYTKAKTMFYDTVGFCADNYEPLVL
ncbi:MAG: carboxypeptidase regulatory-like domain-containing protein [Eubacterium sp.]|nr:carboxypeptidase regulatory-like domain-containing protein [Eubacterium sp.]